MHYITFEFAFITLPLLYILESNPLHYFSNVIHYITHYFSQISKLVHIETFITAHNKDTIRSTYGKQHQYCFVNQQGVKHYVKQKKIIIFFMEGFWYHKTSGGIGQIAFFGISYCSFWNIFER